MKGLIISVFPPLPPSLLHSWLRGFRLSDPAVRGSICLCSAGMSSHREYSSETEVCMRFVNVMKGGKARLKARVLSHVLAFASRILSD